MTGNAELTAEEMQQVLREEFGCDAELRAMENASLDVFRAGTVYLICTSTYGEGEVPEGAKPLYAALCQRRPNLSAIRYAVFGLGDSNYPDTFNFGGKRFDEILSDLGAQRLGERGRHDIRSDVQPWDFGKDWVRAWYVAQRNALG